MGITSVAGGFGAGYSAPNTHARTRTDHLGDWLGDWLGVGLSNGRPLAARLLLALLLAATGLLAADGPARSVAAPRVTIAELAADTDFLFVQAARGVSLDRLVEGIEAMGLDVAGEPRGDGVRVRVPDGARPSWVAARLAGSGLVRSVEADSVVRASGAPNDPLYAGMQQRYLDVVHAPAAWDQQHGDAGVVIAVVDTGLDWDHPDLRERLFVNHLDVFLNGRDDDGNGCVDDIVGCNFVSLTTADPSCGYQHDPPNWRAFDDEGHGTFVAGVAAAAGDNETGLAGVAWQAKILPVKVLDCTATGRISDAAAGIRYAASMGADIINVSFGTLTDSPALSEAVDFARRRGAVVVASAGNDGRVGLTFPARYEGVVSVAASGLERFDGIDYRATAPFANFGSDVDFLAPGVDLMSTVPSRRCGQDGWTCVEDGPYGFGTGSSFATPMVSGALALLVAQYPQTSGDFLVAILKGARQPGATLGDSRVLDIGAALERTFTVAGAAGVSRDGDGDPPGPAPQE